MDTDRRSFAGVLLAGIASVPILGAAFVAVRALLTPATTTPRGRLPVCRAADVPKTGFLSRVVQFRQRRGPSVETVSTVVLLSRDASGAIYALSGVCTHMRCPVQIDASDTARPLVCRCHDGRFAADGTVLSGPPPRPLERMPIDVPADGEGMIHLSES